MTGLTLLAAAGLRADFSYDQTSKITGGAMASMMKVVGVFSKSAREPIKTSVLVRGDIMAHTSADNATVIDVGRETITEVNFRQKTYSVITFAEMARYLEAMSKKAAQQSGGKGEMNFKASVKETGQTRQISGLDTREVVLTMVMEGTDKESGQKGSMTVTSNMWLARNVPGYQEVRAFNQKMAQKLAWMPGSNALAQGRGDLAKAFGDLQKEGAKLDGVPVLQLVSMGAAGEGQPGEPAPQASQGGQEGESSRPGIGGALGRLGGLGGLGRRKKQEEPPPQQQQQQQQTAATGAPGALMEMTTEMTNFSSGPIDAARLQVPAGFRQVENEMAKALR
ncbi:MAG TPA: hypothetical protein VLH09_03050 [Bryobacteraceae bacterium]|nr:hypothetical protein [Bryobacteraceae bacterium]